MANSVCGQKLVAEALIVLVLMGSLESSSQEPPPLDKRTQLLMEVGLKNPIIVKSFVNCYLDQGPCTLQAEQAKQMFQQHYMSTCSNCTEEEETYLKTFCSTFHSRYKEDYDKIVAKYDPNNVNSEAFQAWFTDNRNSE